MNKTVIWARVSTEEQRKKGYSIDEQIAFCKDFAKKIQLKIIKEFHVSESGGYDSKKMKNKEREQYNTMLNFVSTKGFPLILVKERDRLFRSQEDNMELRKLQRKYPYKIQYALTSEILESNMLPEKRYAHDMIVQGDDYTLLKIQYKTKEGLKQKANSGWYPCFAPTGYKNKNISAEKNDRKGNIIVVDEENKNFPVALFKLYATGNFSFASLSEEMNTRGYTSRYGKSITKRLVQSTLKNPFYTGLFRWNGQIYEGNHPPLIDKSLFDKTQEIIQHNINAKIKTKRNFIYRRILKCGGCGRSLVGEIQKGAHNSGIYIYYRCWNSDCDQDFINEKILDSAFHKELDKLKIDADMKNWAIKVLRNSISDDKEKNKTRLYHLKVKEKKIINRKDILLNNLLDNLVEGSGFTADEIQRKANQLQNQLFDIRVQIKKLEKANDSFIDQGVALLNLASNIKENFLKLDIEQKANVLNILFKKCPVKDKKIKIVWNPPFNYISELGNRKRGG